MRSHRAAFGVVLVVLAAGGSALGATHVNQHDPLDDLGVLRSGKIAEVEANAKTSLNEQVVDEYGLDLANARVAGRVQGLAIGRGSSSPSGEGTWIVIPGTRGVCLIPGDRSLVCGAIEGFATGQLALTTLPTRVGQPYVPRKSPGIAAGGGMVQGLVPDGVTHVAALDAGGAEIAVTTVTSNVYELEVAAFRDLSAVRLVHDDGRTTEVSLGVTQ